MFQTSSILNSSQNCQFLLYLARLQKTIELQRQNLCEIQAFEPYCAFRMIDRECKNFITAINVQDFLSIFNYNFEPNMIYSAFIMRYDADKDGVLNYPEYTIIF